MDHATATAALIPSTRLALRGTTRQARTIRRAVALTPVAAAAQTHLDKAPRAQEQPGGFIHAHLGPKPKVLDGLVPARHTACSTAFIGTV
jgi:hypothetical protein